MPPLRIATFNIRHGLGMDGRVDLTRIAAVLRATTAEVVIVQEVDRWWTRSGSVDQPSVLAELSGLRMSFFPTVVRGESRYGLVLASTEPLEAGAFPLPRLGSEEPRIFVRARFGDVTFLGTHLSRSAEARRVQTLALAEEIRTAEGPVVVAGDLNQGPSKLGPLRAAGLAGLARTLRTHPSIRPRRAIDHVLAGGGADVRAAWTLPTRSSDHRPLVAEIDL